MIRMVTITVSVGLIRICLTLYLHLLCVYMTYMYFLLLWLYVMYFSDTVFASFVRVYDLHVFV